MQVLLVSTAKGRGLRGFLYHDGYIRTSCKKFALKSLKDRLIHLTNDAVQKKSASYGKFEPGNKMSYKEFAAYLEHHHNKCGQRVFDTILPAYVVVPCGLPRGLLITTRRPLTYDTIHRDGDC